jgi:hypothetical protein
MRFDKGVLFYNKNLQISKRQKEIKNESIMPHI